MVHNLQRPVTLIMWCMSACTFLKIYYHTKLQDLKVKGCPCTSSSCVCLAVNNDFRKLRNGYGVGSNDITLISNF